MDEWKEDKPMIKSLKASQNFGWDEEDIYV